MKGSILILGTVMASLSLWTTKLYTADFCHVNGITGIILRTTPSMDNREHPGEDASAPTEHLYLIRGSEWGYIGRDVYLWLMDYGYACSTGLSLVLLALALTRRRRKPEVGAPRS